MPLFKILKKRHAIKVLYALYGKNPQRFKHLKKQGIQESTLSLRLRELEEENLIKSVIVKEKRRKWFAYQLTQKGIKTVETLKQLEKIE